VEPDPACQWRIKIHGFTRDPTAGLLILLEVQCPHIVEAIGKLDQKHPNIIYRRKNEFLEIFRLFRHLAAIFEPAEFGDAVDEFGNILAKNLLDIAYRNRFTVFNRVVQHARQNRRLVKMYRSEQRRDPNWVGIIRLTGLTFLNAMLFFGEGIGRDQPLAISIRLIGDDEIGQLVWRKYRFFRWMEFIQRVFSHHPVITRPV